MKALPIIFSIIMILLVWFASTFAPPKYPPPKHEYVDGDMEGIWYGFPIGKIEEDGTVTLVWPKHEPRVNLNQEAIDYWRGMQERFVVIEAREVKTR